MAKKRSAVPEYTGIYKDHRLTIDEARPKVIAALNRLYARDAMLLTLDVSEECIVHKFTKYLTPKFRDLHVDAEYNGWFDRHPKYLYRLCEMGKGVLERKESYPDVLAHWRRKPVNVMVVEVKKSTNIGKKGREIDDFKLRSFTAPMLPFNETFHYHVGLFLDIATGIHIKDELVATATWYVDGVVRLKEVLPSKPYFGP